MAECEAECYAADATGVSVHTLSVDLENVINFPFPIGWCNGVVPTL